MCRVGDRDQRQHCQFYVSMHVAVLLLCVCQKHSIVVHRQSSDDVVFPVIFSVNHALQHNSFHQSTIVRPADIMSEMLELASFDCIDYRLNLSYSASASVINDLLLVKSKLADVSVLSSTCLLYTSPSPRD